MHNDKSKDKRKAQKPMEAFSIKDTFHQQDAMKKTKKADKKAKKG